MMKNKFHNDLNFTTNASREINPTVDKLKTTNVNILLNRVKLDQKKDFRKKAILLFILAIVICITSFLAIF